MQKKLLLLSFAEGAVVMAAELCGAKLLAPVFGSSLYVWSSVMGITLGALALGYFFGGYFSANTLHRTTRLFLILITASLFVMAMPLISYYLVPRISYLPFLTGVVLSSITLLFFPVFLLGASSPFFISLQTNEAVNAGKVSGTVYAVSTAGGIMATFTCGFWLIPQIGLSACLYLFGVLLFALAFTIGDIKKASYIFFPIALFYLSRQVLFKKEGDLLFSEGLLGTLQVKDAIVNNGDTVRYMAVNGIIQTECTLHQSGNYQSYLTLLDTLVPPSFTKKKALLLGLGGGISANILIGKNYNVDAVEFDQRIIDVATKYFYMNPKVKTYCADARYFLNTCHNAYNLVLFDVFKAEEQPAHVLTSESLANIKKNMLPNSRIIVNWHGFVDQENGKGSSVLFATLQKAGFNVKICSLNNSPEGRNLFFVAALQKLDSLPYQLKETMASTTQLNTDELPLIEKYNALANKKWRAGYLRYYQQKQN